MSTFDFDNLVGRDKIALIYTAYYGRLPDPTGFDFWNDFFRLGTGAGISSQDAALQIADFFLDQDETRSKYAFFEDPAIASVDDISRFLDEVYYNLFNRTPDVAGKAFWSAQIFSRLENNQGFGDLLVQVIEGAQANDIAAMDNKLAVGKHYVENIGDSFDITQATRIALDTTADASTVTANITAIDAFVAGTTTAFEAGRSDIAILVSDDIGGEIALVNTAVTSGPQIIASTGLDGITDIAMNPNGELWISTLTTLYSYSFAADTLVEVLTFPTSVNALGTDANGTLYAAGPDVPTLYKIDTASGEVTSIGNLPSPAAGDIAATESGVTVSLMNDDITFVGTALTDEVVTMQSNADVSTFEALVLVDDQIIAGAGKDIIDITDADNYNTLVNIDHSSFDTISGATYVYDSLANYLIS